MRGIADDLSTLRDSLEQKGNPQIMQGTVIDLIEN